ncbi:hypothetical protein ACO0LO_04775 [Undibacterium sp. TJN25]|uniref:hypothetical protein n=1 Tax=Undibacterium sp. TJN25 TaxID=3413056 RepID=UPI003BEF7D12
MEKPVGVAQQAEVGSAEAMNLNALGDYSFCYGSLLMLALLGVLALMIVLGMPVYGRAGHLGAVDIFNVLSRLSAGMLLLLAAYAEYCRMHSSGKVRLSAGVQLFALAIVFWCAGFSNADAGTAVVHLLGWLGSTCSVACGTIFF